VRPSDPFQSPTGAPASSPNGPTRPLGEPRPGERAAGGDDLLAAWGEIRGDLTRIARETREIGSLRVERAKLAANEGLHVALMGSFAGVTAITVTVVATALLVAGLAGAIGALAGALWIGMLAVGALALCTAAVALVVLRGRRRTAFRERLERKFGPVPGSAQGEGGTS
jgi:hypothetical protein